MKHHVTPRCKHECRFLQINDGLWLCPHSAFGEASYYKGAIDDARAVLERAGGYAAVLARIEGKELEARAASREKRESQSKRLAESVKYE